MIVVISFPTENLYWIFRHFGELPRKNMRKPGSGSDTHGTEAIHAGIHKLQAFGKSKQIYPGLWKPLQAERNLHWIVTRIIVTRVSERDELECEGKTFAHMKVMKLLIVDNECLSAIWMFYCQTALSSSQKQIRLQEWYVHCAASHHVHLLLCCWDLSISLSVVDWPSNLIKWRVK